MALSLLFYVQFRVNKNGQYNKPVIGSFGKKLALDLEDRLWDYDWIIMLFHEQKGMLIQEHAVLHIVPQRLKLPPNVNIKPVPNY